MSELNPITRDPYGVTEEPLEETIDRLRGEWLKELAEDAMRYRWLRVNINAVHFCQYMNYHESEEVMWASPAAIDAAIDSALRRRISHE